MGLKMNFNKKKYNLIFIIVIISSILTSFFSTALNTALPQIMKDYNISAAMGQWITSIYSMMMGISVLATAYLVKKFKTKKIFISSLFLFTFGLGLDALSLPFGVFILGRIFQAVANGILLSLTQIIILTIFPIEKRGSYMGIYGLAVGGAPVIAPTLAGIIIDSCGWRMIMYGTMFFMVALIVMSAITFENLLVNENTKFDFVSLSFCALGYIGILIGLGNIGSYAWSSMNVLLPVILGMVGSGVFIYRQLYLDKPFLDIRILKVKEYRTALIASMLLYLAMMAATILIPIYVQTIREYSATVSGLVMMPGSIAMAVISPMAGRIYDKLGIKKLFIGGSILQLLSYAGMAVLSYHTSMIYLAVMLVIRNLAIGCLIMPLVTWGMSKIEKQKTSDGTALFTSLRTVAGAVGSAVFIGVMTIVESHTSSITGIDVAFICLTAVTVIQLIIAIFFCNISSIKTEKL